MAERDAKFEPIASACNTADAGARRMKRIGPAECGDCRDAVIVVRAECRAPLRRCRCQVPIRPAAGLGLLVEQHRIEAEFSSERRRCHAGRPRADDSDVARGWQGCVRRLS